MEMNSAIVIREIREGDLPMLLSWRNHPSIGRFMLSNHLISIEEHEAWFFGELKNPKYKRLLIEEQGNSIGYVQFKLSSFKNEAIWGFYKKPESPHEYGKKLGITALNYAFMTLKMEKIHGHVFTINQKSIAFHLSLGFLQRSSFNGLEDQSGAEYPMIKFVLTRPQWQKNIPFFDPYCRSR